MRGRLVRIQSLVPSTQPVLWEIGLKYCIFWRKQIDPFALRVFINLIHGMRNPLWNGSLAFEFHIHFYFCQSFHAAFELPFTSLSQHRTFLRLCCQFQESECPTCCLSKYIKSDLFSINEELILYTAYLRSVRYTFPARTITANACFSKTFEA